MEPALASATNSYAGATHGGQHSCFTDEHQSLRESITTFCEQELAPHADAWEESGFPDSVFRRMGELGFLGVNFPSRYGGGDGDYFTSIVRSESMAHARCGGLSTGIAIHTDMATPPILEFGSEDLKRRYLEPAIAGTKIAALGITEPGGGSDVAAIRTDAVRDGDDWLVNGSKTFITNGARADFIVLLVKTEPAGRDGMTLLCVDTASTGFEVVRELDKVGMRAVDAAELSFTNVRVPAENVIGEVGRGFQQVMWELQGERLNGAASAVAVGQRVFDDTLGYATQRSAFGRPIGKFQAIRHKLAEMATKLEAARQLIYNTAARFQAGEYPVREITMAKLFAAQTVCEACDQCLQIHGGNGYLREYGIERAWRDMRVNRIGGGTDEIMLEVIGRSYGL